MDRASRHPPATPGRHSRLLRLRTSRYQVGGRDPRGHDPPAQRLRGHGHGLDRQASRAPACRDADRARNLSNQLGRSLFSLRAAQAPRGRAGASAGNLPGARAALRRVPLVVRMRVSPPNRRPLESRRRNTHAAHSRAGPPGRCDRRTARRTRRTSRATKPWHTRDLRSTGDASKAPDHRSVFGETTVRVSHAASARTGARAVAGAITGRRILRLRGRPLRGRRRA